MAEITEFQAEVFLIIAGLSFGNIPIISAILRNNNVSTIEQVLMRAIIGCGFGLIVLFFSYAYKKPEVLLSFSVTNQFYYFIQGLLLNFMIIVYFIAIALDTPVGEAALLVQVQPLLTLLLGALFLKEYLTKEKVISLLLAFLGLFILIRPWELHAFLVHIVGDIFALSNGILYSLYLIIGRFSNKYRNHISPLISISFVLCYMFITFLPLVFVFQILPVDPIINSFSFSVYNSIFIIELGILLGLFGSVLPYGLIMIASKHVESSKSAILVLGEPLGAIIFGFLILGEPITIFYIIGGALLLGAIVFLTLTGTKPGSRVNLVIPKVKGDISQNI